MQKKSNGLLLIGFVLICLSCSTSNHIFISNQTMDDAKIRVVCDTENFDITDITNIVYFDTIFTTLDKIAHVQYISGEENRIDVSNNDGKAYDVSVKSKTTAYLLPTDQYTLIEKILINKESLILTGTKKNYREYNDTKHIHVYKSRRNGTLIQIK